MEKMNDWEKDLLLQDLKNIPEKTCGFSSGSSHIATAVLYGVAAFVAIAVFMWGQT